MRTELQLPQNQVPYKLPNDKKDLAKVYKKLNKLCAEINPYESLSPSQKKRLKEFQILDTFDPFTITNKLLVLLDEVTTQLEENK